MILAGIMKANQIYNYDLGIQTRFGQFLVRLFLVHTFFYSLAALRASC